MRLDDDRYAHQENIVITVEGLLRVCESAHERRMIAEMITLSRSSILQVDFLHVWPAIYVQQKALGKTPSYNNRLLSHGRVGRA